MSIFYTDTGSLLDLEVSGSTLISGSGSSVFSVSGSRGSALNVYDLTDSTNVFQIISGSIDLLKIVPSGDVHISGTLIITGSYQYDPLISAGTTSNKVSQLVLSNENNISFGLNGSTVTATYNLPVETFSYYNPKDAYVQALGTWGSNSLFMQPFQVKDVQFDRVAIPIYISKPGNNNSNLSVTLSMHWGLYTRSVSTLNLLTDFSSMSSFQSTVSNTNNSLYDGIRLFTMGLTQTLPENQYYLAMLSNVTTGGQGTLSNIVASQQNSSFFGLFGQAHNQTIQYTRGLGFYSTTTSALPSSIAFSQLYGAVTNTSMTTGTVLLRPPVFYVVSQTF